MAKLNAVDSLKESIRLLEIRQAEEGRILKEQFKITYESLKPVNLIKSSLKELTSSPEIKNSLMESIISVLTGYITNKITIGSKKNPLMRILGMVLKFGVTSLVSKNVESIRKYISDLIDKFFKPAEVQVAEGES